MALKTWIVVFLLLVLVNGASAKTIKIETQSPYFFDNVVLDSLLLMDRELQRVLANDISHLVKSASFTPQPSRWLPRPPPKGRLLNIYNSINAKNLSESFTSMVAPVIEMACTSRHYDPLNDSSSKCVSQILKYPIIDLIQINYTYVQGKSFDQLVSNLQNSTNADRYQNIVSTLADLMNSGYQKNANTRIAKKMNVIKYPLPLVATTGSSVQNGTSGGMTNEDIINEKALLNAELDRKRIECTDAKHNMAQRKSCDKAKDAIREQLEVIEKTPSMYFAYKQKRMSEELAQASRRQSATPTSYEQDEDYVKNGSANKQQEYFLTNGGMMMQPPGSAFATTSKGETYFKPEGSAFSYGTGTNSGKTCFHYGNFADCK